MKSFIPYAPFAILGLIGAVGAVAATHSGGGGGVPPVTDDGHGPVRVRASLDRTVLPANGGEAFLRVALEGVPPNDKVQQKRVPVSLTLVIDRSGSMGTGSKMDDAKRAAIDAMDALAQGDRVCVVSFDDGAESHGCATLGDGDAALRTAVSGLFARGGTDMASGLSTGGTAAKSIYDGGRINRMLLLSDGRPDNERGLKDQVQSIASAGITTTTLGLGQDYNEDLMSGLADAGLGHYYFVERADQLHGIFADELSSLSAVVARQASIELVPGSGVEIKDVIGFRFDRSGNSVVIPAGDVYGGRTTDILVRLQVPAGTGDKDVVFAHVSYIDARTTTAMKVDRPLAAKLSSSESDVKNSTVAEVAVKAEKWRAANAVLEANAAFDRGDVAAGNGILTTSTARLKNEASVLAAPELAKEAQVNEDYKAQNEAGGAAWRGVGTKAAKKRAWSMNKGSAY